MSKLTVGPSRRQWIGGATAGLTLLGLGEGMRLGGAWDHQQMPAPGPPLKLQDLPSDGFAHLGQSTHLISVDGKKFLTDPWFLNPAFGVLEKRVVAAVAELEGLSGILITHHHPDHFDPKALDRFSEKRVPVFVGSRTLVSRMKSLGFSEVTLMPTWGTIVLGGVTVHALPAVHDVEEQGFAVSGQKTCVYFAGDTGDHGEFEAIRERVSPVVAILPIDGTSFRWRGPATLGPREAVVAVQALGARLGISSHVDAVYKDFTLAHFMISREEDPSSSFSAAAQLAGVNVVNPVHSAVMPLPLRRI